MQLLGRCNASSENSQTHDGWQDLVWWLESGYTLKICTQYRVQTWHEGQTAFSENAIYPQ